MSFCVAWCTVTRSPPTSSPPPAITSSPPHAPKRRQPTKAPAIHSHLIFIPLAKHSQKSTQWLPTRCGPFDSAAHESQPRCKGAPPPHEKKDSKSKSRQRKGGSEHQKK